MEGPMGVYESRPDGSKTMQGSMGTISIGPNGVRYDPNTTPKSEGNGYDNGNRWGGWGGWKRWVGI
jgi:hypothetical protein